MIVAKNISKSVRGETLLKDVSFVLSNGDKCALIGPNGCGKSTLLNILLGNVERDGGLIQNEGEQVGYLPQLIEFSDNITAAQYVTDLVNETTPKHRIEAILTRLGLSNYDGTQKMVTLSEGQKMKFALAQTLSINPTLILLDEPTNHLDIEGIVWFERFIKSFEGTVLMISHDRRFLDNVVNKIFEIDEKRLSVFAGNYSDYKAQKQTLLHRREIEFRSQERKRKQLEVLLENARKVKDGKSRGKRVRAAKKRMDREVLKNEIEKYQPYEIDGISFDGSIHRHKKMITIENLTQKFGDNTIFADLNFELVGHERIWIYGPNGTGKTTLLQIITQNLKPTSGKAGIGVNVNYGYFEQNQAHLPLESTVEEFVAKTTSLPYSKIFGFLSGLSFDREYLSRALAALSPGERARLSLGIFTQNEYNLLILDEPTNHLDIWTKEAVEQALREFKGAILLVSHDRYFVEQVGAHKILNLQTGNITLL
ncbi:ABC-F family ATP-binding cassette domain-containing protein [candidate division WWE3 bacterium]|uniref:ABC-F family ATP-binding cassette domain-containing protein n=1 Tax=candidate division WWE3 bacterium TaxID=2053526 RepID=A0A955LJS1_UNCKA|nr:ABC-F family ATP-binding cassette domain-containing protein [candidate division WWE3 bacterium]